MSKNKHILYNQFNHFNITVNMPLFVWKPMQTQYDSQYTVSFTY